MRPLTPIDSLLIIDAASTANVRLGRLLDDAASAAGDRFLQRAPEFGENYVARTLDAFTESSTAMQKLVDALPAEGHATSQAVAGVARLGTMREVFAAGGMPFNFVDEVTDMRASLQETIRGAASDGLSAARRDMMGV